MRRSRERSRRIERDDGDAGRQDQAHQEMEREEESKSAFSEILVRVQEQLCMDDGESFSGFLGFSLKCKD